MVLNHERREALSEETVVPQGIYLTEDPTRSPGIKLWCGYCAQPIHVGSQHWGTSPFLSLVVKMAQAHREASCPNPSGPFLAKWSPRKDGNWGWGE
jgi:hypothetical protein